ncbi:MAG TPA: ABC transporter permease [Bacteroidales bacterium]|nr:ABC transporter permease [Bacteroidales bacterium]HPS72854.1 ABC transporter permease [Bacteroidales bacterium]
MKRFWGFVVKEFFHIFRDYRTLLILFGMPAVQLMLFGFVLTNEIKDARIAVLDLSKDETTRKLTEKITSSGYFLLDRNLSSFNQIEPAFREGNIKMVIVFGKDFEKKLKKENAAKVQLIGDASDPNTANILVNYASGILNSSLLTMNAGQIPLQILPETRMLYNPELKGVYMFVPGLMAMLMILISALMTSISITKEKETGTMELLLASPLRPAQIIIGKVFPYVFLAFIDACVILLLANLVFGVPLAGSVFLLLLETLLYIIMALSLGILVSTVTNSQQIAMMVSLMALMLPTILLSGFIFPIANMPQIMQWLCAVMPPKYYIIIIKGIMLQGNGLAFLWRETLVLVGFTTIFILLSIKNFKTRLA